MVEDMCPSCNDVPASRRQETRPHLCAWCGYNYETKQPAVFVPASHRKEEDDFFNDGDDA